MNADISTKNEGKLSFPLKIWGITYLCSLLAYLPFLFTFLWGNHDWGWIKEYTPLGSGLFEGRFSQFILPTLLFEGNILPVLYLATALLFFCGAAVLLLKLWHIPQKTGTSLFITLALVTAPYTISWLYFAFITFSILSWTLIVVWAFYLLRHPFFNLSLGQRHIFACILFILSLGGYPPVINMIGVIFFTLCLNDLCFKRQTFRTFYRTHRGIVANILVALIIFSIILAIFKKYDIQKDTYNTTEVAFSNLFEQLQNTFSSATKQFFITTNFIGYFYKYINFCFVLLGAVILLRNCPKNLFSISATLLCFAGMLFSSCITTFLTGRTEYVNFEPRIEFFGILYIYIYALTLIFRSKYQGLANLTGVLLVILIFQNTSEIAYAAKIWQFGFRAEGNLSERIIKRIENSPTFSSYKHTFVQGGTLDFRSRYIVPQHLNKIDSYTAQAPYIPWHLPSKAYSFYQPYNFFGSDSDIFWLTVNPFTLNFSENLQNYLLRDSRVWPDIQGIYVDESTIILTLSPEGKMQAQQFAEKIL